MGVLVGREVGVGVLVGLGVEVTLFEGGGVGRQLLELQTPQNPGTSI